MDMRFGFHGWYACRYRRAAIAGMTLLSFAVGEVSHVRAAWVPIPISQKAEPLQPKKNGYAAIIRRTLEDSRALAEAGNYDRAIVLAERAHRLSLSSSTIKRQDPDLAPELLAKYASELRLKKVENNIQRVAAAKAGRHQNSTRDRQVATRETPSVPTAPVAPAAASIASIPAAPFVPASPSISSIFSEQPAAPSIPAMPPSSYFSGELAAEPISIPPSPSPSPATVVRNVAKPADTRTAVRIPTPSPSATPVGPKVQAVSSIGRATKQGVVTINFDHDDKAALNQVPASPSISSPSAAEQPDLRQIDVPSPSVTESGVDSEFDPFAAKKEMLPPIMARAGKSKPQATAESTDEQVFGSDIDKDVAKAPEEDSTKNSRTLEAMLKRSFPDASITCRALPDDCMLLEGEVADIQTMMQVLEIAHVYSSNVINHAKLRSPVVAEQPARSGSMRLRQRFETDEPILATLPEENESSSRQNVPEITPRSKGAIEVERTSLEPGRIVEEINEPALQSEPFAMEPKDSLQDLAGKFEQSWDDEPAARFPKDKVIALKRKMESAIALNPGEIVGGLTTEPVMKPSWDDSAEEQKVENRRLRFRKLPRSRADNHSNLAEQIGKGRQSNVAQGSVIQWKTVATTDKQLASTDKFETKSRQLKQDLRQSLNRSASDLGEMTPAAKEPSLIALPKTEIARTDRATRPELAANSTSSRGTSNKNQIRGSVWDNASAPAASGFSGTIGGTGKMMNSQAVELGYAPKPPADLSVEQASFDKPAELFSRRTSAMMPGQDEQYEEADDRALEVSAAATPRSIFTTSPLEWPSLLFGIPMSTGSIIFGAAGASLLVAGFWVVHETIRSKNS